MNDNTESTRPFNKTVGEGYGHNRLDSSLLSTLGKLLMSDKDLQARSISILD